MVCGKTMWKSNRYKTRCDITGWSANRSREQCDVIERGCGPQREGRPNIWMAYVWFLFLRLIYFYFDRVMGPGGGRDLSEINFPRPSAVPATNKINCLRRDEVLLLLMLYFVLHSSIFSILLNEIFFA